MARDTRDIERDLAAVRRWNQQEDEFMSDNEPEDTMLPSGRHMKYHHRRHHYSGRHGRHGGRYRHRYAGDAIDGAEDFHDSPAHHLTHRDDYYAPPNSNIRSRRGEPAGGSFVARYYDDAGSDIDDADLAGLDLDYRHGRRPRQPRAAGDRYFDEPFGLHDGDVAMDRLAPAAQPGMLSAADYMHVGDVVDDDNEDLIDYQLPINWQTSEFRFRREVSLESLWKNKVSGIVIDFNDTYKNNKSVQDLLASGAYLGPVSVGGLRAVNAHVSLAVRGESRGNRQLGYDSVPIKDANQYLPDVNRVVHAVIPKRGPQAAAGVDFSLRDTAAVTPTWLSEHPDYTVHTLGKDIKATLTKGVDEISTRHPIAQWLIAEGRLPDEELQEHDTVHVDHQDVVDARRAIETEERNNPKIGDARSLRLVLVRAYTDDKQAAGVPRWTDKTEIADDYPIDKRTTSLIKARQSAPIVIEGYWKIEHGHPAAAPVAMLEDQDAHDMGVETMEDMEAFD